MEKNYVLVFIPYNKTFFKIFTINLLYVIFVIVLKYFFIKINLASEDNTIRLWDLETRQCEAILLGDKYS
jgi:hypothetical protein